MVRFLSVVCLGAAVAFAAAPKLSQTTRKFPTVNLPMTLVDAKPLTVALDPAEVAVLLQKPEALPGDLRSVKRPLEEGETRSVFALGTARAGTVQVVFIRVDETTPMSKSQATYALTVNGEAVVSAALVHTESSSEAGGATMEATVAADGSISRKVRTEIPMHDEGLPETMAITSEVSLKLRPDGTFAPAVTVFGTQTGKYVDAKSKEELWVFDQRVFYRGTESKPFQTLEFDGKAVRFKSSKAPYALVWNAARSAITCTDPKGKAQTFTREW